MALLITLLVVSLAVNCTFSARIAGFMTFGGSQYINIRHILEELVSRGHEVAMVVPSSQKIKPSQRVPHKVYQVPLKPDFVDIAVKREMEGEWVTAMTENIEIQTGICEGLLNSTEILEEIKGFDLIVYDAPITVCAQLVGELLDIPRVEILIISPPFLGLTHMAPMPVSYVPQPMLGFSDKMTFVQRVLNSLVYLGSGVLLGPILFNPMNALKVKYNIKPERSYQETAANVEMVLISADFALEYPQPLLPGHVMVGPLNVKDSKPLPPNLEEFISGSGEHGFIIVSFGSNVASLLPRNEVDMLATAFGELNQRVFWRLKGYIPSFLGSNIKVMDWLPQNDLLGHKDIKAFVSHVGHNGLYEAAYHGVPVVAYPLFAEQHSNAKKLEHFGFGLSVDHKTANAQQIFEAIEQVISEPSFKQKALHISGLLKDRPRLPLLEACDWIEHVIRHGGARHLRAQVFNIPWYQYYLLDVIAFLVTMVILVVMVIKMACGCVCRLCCKRSETKPKKE